MSVPNHPAKPRQVWITYEDDTTVVTTPNQLAFFRLQIIFTECAIYHGKNVNENGI
jgi:hypothetical protein